MTSETATAHAKSASSRNGMLIFLRARTFVALILVLAYFSFAAPKLPDAGKTRWLVTKHVAINAFLAIGMTFVIITGGIDLSVGSVVGLCAMAAGWLATYGIDLGFGWSIQFKHARDRLPSSRFWAYSWASSTGCS